MMLLISPALLCLFLVGYFTEKDSLAVDGIGWGAYCYPRVWASFITIFGGSSGGSWIGNFRRSGAQPD